MFKFFGMCVYDGKFVYVIFILKFLNTSLIFGTMASRTGMMFFVLGCFCIML